MAGNNSTMETLMTLMALKAATGNMDDLTITPLAIKVNVSPISVSCHIESNKKTLKDFGAEEWFQETKDRIEPIMQEQTTKFMEIMKEKFGLSYCEDQDMDDTLRRVFGGVKPTLIETNITCRRETLRQENKKGG